MRRIASANALDRSMGVEDLGSVRAMQTAKLEARQNAFEVMVFGKGPVGELHGASAVSLSTNVTIKTNYGSDSVTVEGETYGIRCVNDAGLASCVTPDLVMVCTQADPVAMARTIASMKQVVRDKTVIIVAANGYDPSALVRQAFPRNAVAAEILSVQVCHAGDGDAQQLQLNKQVKYERCLKQVGSAPEEETVALIQTWNRMQSEFFRDMEGRADVRLGRDGKADAPDLVHWLTPEQDSAARSAKIMRNIGNAGSLWVSAQAFLDDVVNTRTRVLPSTYKDGISDPLARRLNFLMVVEQFGLEDRDLAEHALRAEFEKNMRYCNTAHVPTTTANASEGKPIELGIFEDKIARALNEEKNPAEYLPVTQAVLKLCQLLNVLISARHTQSLESTLNVEEVKEHMNYLKGIIEVGGVPDWAEAIYQKVGG
ncbi:MAG: hypothetical protein O3A01_09100 [bacterium]|nr:hypothetical protein [bacterium]